MGTGRARSRPAAAYARDSDEAMIRIMSAYMILADMDRRDQYDRTHPEPGQRSRDRQPATVTWIGRRPGNSIMVTPVRWH